MGGRQLRAARLRNREACRIRATAPDGKPGRAAEREIRWSMPSVSDDGKLAVASARSADNKDRWFVTLDPETGKTKVIDTLHDEAWIRELGFGGSASSSCPTAGGSGSFRSETAGCTSIRSTSAQRGPGRPS